MEKRMEKMFCSKLSLRLFCRVPTLSSKVLKMTTASASTAEGRFHGKVAIVTGSTDGIGLAVARRLAQDGAEVMISSRKADKVTKVVSELKAENLKVEGIVCHAGQSESREQLVEKTIKQFGGIDILVNNVGASPYFGSVMDTPEAAYDKLFELNVKAGFFMSKAVFPHMEKRGGGSIIFNSSIAAYQPLELLGIYSVCKTALLGLVKAMSMECGRSNIRVNGVAPGIIETKFSQPITSNETMSTEVMKQFAIKRFGVPEDVAGVVSFLCSQDAAYITGEIIPISGGMLSHL